MVKKLIVSVLLVGSLASASEDNLRSFELETSTRYVRGRFDVKKDGSALLTPSMMPTKERAQAATIDEERISSLAEEFADRDRRERVMDTETFPWCIHGQMNIVFGSGIHRGSGVLVGPHHFLTAAHNVYKSDRLEQARNIKIRLGLNDEMVTFGEVLGSRVYLYDQWMRSGNKGFDIALVILNQSIGLETGWAGLLCLEDGELRDRSVHVTGYPGSKGFKTLWTMEDKISRLEREKLYYLVDTSKGQSGGAIWKKERTMPFVLGVHAYEGTIMDGGNYGVRLSESKIRTIVGWIRETLVIDEPALPAPSASRGGGREAPVTGGAGGAGRIVSPSRALSTVPPVAIGHEAEYQRFLNGVLTYKPNKDNDVGRVDLPIRALANPLEGTFDLSRFGDTGQYISIHTGYKKAKIPENDHKIEIWFTPKFLVEANLGGDAAWLRGIMDEWTHTWGMFWTMGGRDCNGDNFDYLLSVADLEDKGKNLNNKWLSSNTAPSPAASTAGRGIGRGQWVVCRHILF